jgi:hypothetical protein
MHGLLRPNVVAFLFACDRMTTATGIQIRVMTHSAGIIVFFMRFMIERYRTHQNSRSRLWSFCICHYCLDQDDVGLIALHPGDVFDRFYQLKLLLSVTTAAFDWPGFLVFSLWHRLVFSQGFSVALDAR